MNLCRWWTRLRKRSMNGMTNEELARELLCQAIDAMTELQVLYDLDLEPQIKLLESFDPTTVGARYGKHF